MADGRHVGIHPCGGHRTSSRVTFAGTDRKFTFETRQIRRSADNRTPPILEALANRPGTRSLLWDGLQGG
jgi:hypothetical protein